MAVELKQVHNSAFTKDGEAFIQANNLDEALGYFKGRYGVVGVVVKKKTNTIFHIKERRL